MNLALLSLLVGLMGVTLLPLLPPPAVLIPLLCCLWFALRRGLLRPQAMLVLGVLYALVYGWLWQSKQLPERCVGAGAPGRLCGRAALGDQAP